MHINALFVCSLIPGSYYIRFDELGLAVDMPLYLATSSLLPIVSQPENSVAGGTWWSQVTDADIIDAFKQARTKNVGTVIVTELHAQQIMALPPDSRKNLELIVLFDTKQALYDVARAWRSQCIVPIIAVTGSIGKTTTIDMLAAIFNVDRLPVLMATAHTHSVHDIALNILHITSKQIAAIFEIGILEPGDMYLCADIMRPTIAIITAVCQVHVNNTRELQQVFSCFSPSQVGIVCGDYPVLVSHFYEHPVVRFGLKNKNTITARKVTLFRDETGINKTKLVLRVYDYEREIILPGHHKALVYGALAASALAYFLYVPFEVVVKGISAYIPVSGGFHHYFLRNGRGFLMEDTHSISPDSVKASLHAVHAIGSPQSRKIAVIGAIPDLGERTLFWHRHVGRELIKTRSISDIVLVGDDTRSIRSVAPATMNVWFAAEWDEAQGQVQNLMAPADNVVLVSGVADHAITKLVAQLV